MNCKFAIFMLVNICMSLFTTDVAGAVKWEIERNGGGWLWSDGGRDYGEILYDNRMKKLFTGIKFSTLK